MFGFTVLIFVSVLILYAFCKTFIGFGPAQNISFIWGFAGGGCFMASFVFAYFSTNASGLSYLTLPASHLEKWLCGILIAGILYPLAFLVFFRLMDASFISAYRSSLNPRDPLYKTQYASIFVFPFDGRNTWKVYSLSFFLSGSMLLGSLYFNKVGFIKSALTVCLICIGGFGLNWLIAVLFFGNINDAAPFDHVTIQIGNEVGSIEPPKQWASIFSYSLAYVIPILIWGLSFIRLREKEF